MERRHLIPSLLVVDLGRHPYADTLALQRSLCRRRIEGALEDDILLLVEHEPVITLGRGTRADSLTVPPHTLPSHGFDEFEVERGGEATCHEPGQLVGYPILDLQRHRADLHWYLRTLEAALIDAVAALGVPAVRRPGRTGVWVGPRKVASIGIHVKQWVTTHGFALNVTNDLRGFELIVPCGLPDVEMTTVARELSRLDGTVVDLQDRSRAAVVTAVGKAFDRMAVPTELARIAGLAPAPA